MIAIIGGGITGLSAAYELTRRQVPCVLLEASERAGGLIRTEHVSGFTIDGGPDSLFVHKPAGLQLCTELGLTTRLIKTAPPHTSFIVKRNRLYPLPPSSVLGIPTRLRGLLGYKLLSWPARLRMAMEPLVPRGNEADESVASFFRRRFGQAAVDLIADPLLGGIHSGDVEQLSMASLFPRMLEAERRPGKVLRTFARTRSGGHDGPFRALRSGMGELVDTLVARLPAGTVLLNTRVDALERISSAWRVRTDAGTYDAAAVIVTVPAHAASSLLAGIDSSAAAICETVRYVSSAGIVLAYKREEVEHPLAGAGFVVARRFNDLRITACTWSSSKWESRAPAGYVLLRAFVGGAHDPGAVDASDDELIEIATRDLTRVLGRMGAPTLARVYRWRGASAQHNVGHRAAMHMLAERLRAHPGLFVAGSGYSSIGIPDCIEHGRRAGSAAADYVTIGR